MKTKNTKIDRDASVAHRQEFPTSMNPKIGEVYHVVSNTSPLEEIMEITHVTEDKFCGTNLCIIKQWRNRGVNGYKDWKQDIDGDGTYTYTKIEKQDEYPEYLL